MGSDSHERITNLDRGPEHLRRNSPGEDPGAPVSERQVYQGVVDPHGVLEIDLDQREVDGLLTQNPDSRGTWLSSHAYHITTNYPVVAYQFNPIIQSFSNDASLLIPSSGLDT